MVDSGITSFAHIARKRARILSRLRFRRAVRGLTIVLSFILHRVPHEEMRLAPGDPEEDLSLMSLRWGGDG